MSCGGLIWRLVRRRFSLPIGLAIWSSRLAEASGARSLPAYALSIGASASRCAISLRAPHLSAAAARADDAAGACLTLGRPLVHLHLRSSESVARIRANLVSRRVISQHLKGARTTRANLGRRWIKSVRVAKLCGARPMRPSDFCATRRAPIARPPRDPSEPLRLSGALMQSDGFSSCVCARGPFGARATPSLRPTEGRAATSRRPFGSGRIYVRRRRRRRSTRSKRRARQTFSFAHHSLLDSLACDFRSG